MAKLLMITGLGSAVDLSSGKKGAFYNTLEEFHKYWDRIDIICPQANNKFSIFNFQFLKSRTVVLFGNVFVHISPWPLALHPLWFLKKGVEIYREQKFDLMTVQEFPPFYNGIGARLLWQKIRVPYVLEIHHNPKASNFKEMVYRKMMQGFIKRDASKAKMVRIVNRNQVPDFLKKHGVPENKIKYISSLYIDTSIFKPMDLPKEYDLIFVGRLVENKGIHLFLETIKRLNCRAIIVGDGPLKKYLVSSIKHQGLENVVFHGWAKDAREVAELINKSRVLIMPSFNEGGPRVLVEAMACGVPVLATPVGIVPDVIKDGESGGIIDWDPDDIAKKAAILLSESEKYGKYRQAGLGIARQFEIRSAIQYYAESLKKYLLLDNIR